MHTSYSRLSCLFTMLIIFTSVTIQAQIFSYTSSLTGIPAYTDLHTSATNLIRINGALPVTECSDGLNSNKCTSAATFNLTRSAIEFTITPAANFQLNVTSITVGCRRNTKGPQKFRLAYSTTGGSSWQNNGTDYLLSTSAACGSMTTLSWDMPDFSSTGTLLVRLYFFKGTSATAGNLQVQDFIVTGSVTEIDNDADGFAYSADCDDDNATINPEATEICNTLDDNCNGLADDGITATYYFDADGDGYGNADSAITTCSVPPPDYTATSDDCNDAEPLTNPSSAELCNSLDDNCDGNTDEGLPENAFFIDADGDSLGDYYISVNSCYASLSGYSLIPGDCDDADPAINSYAEEVVNGYDDNCDGIIDTAIYYTVFQSSILIKAAQINQETEINIFPNPTSEMLYIQLKRTGNTTEKAWLSIVSADGTCLFSKNYAVDIEDNLVELPVGDIYPKGMYYLKVFCDGETWVKKFVVQ